MAEPRHSLSLSYSEIKTWLNVNAFDIGQYNFAKDNTGGEFNMLLDIFTELVHVQKHEDSI